MLYNSRVPNNFSFGQGAVKSFTKFDYNVGFYNSRVPKNFCIGQGAVKSFTKFDGSKNKKHGKKKFWHQTPHSKDSDTTFNIENVNMGDLAGALDTSRTQTPPLHNLFCRSCELWRFVRLLDVLNSDITVKAILSCFQMCFSDG
jgi:hypothetical protein